MTRYSVKLVEGRSRTVEIEVDAANAEEARNHVRRLEAEWGTYAWETEYEDRKITQVAELETAFYILCTERAIEDRAIYVCNKSVAIVGKLTVLKCPNKFLAEYQLGRLKSCIGWSGSHNVFDSLDAAITEATNNSKFF